MPAPGHTPPKFGPREIEARVAQPAFSRPSWLDGKRTFLGLALSAAGLIGERCGLTVPKDEINDFLDLIGANWDVIAQAAGLLVAAWGRIKASKRFQKDIERATNVALLVLVTLVVSSCRTKSPSAALFGHTNNDYDAGYRAGLWEGIQYSR